MNDEFEKLVVDRDIRPLSDLLEVRDALLYIRNQYGSGLSRALKNVEAEIVRESDRVITHWSEEAPPYTHLDWNTFQYTVDWDAIDFEQIPVVRDYAFRSDHINWPDQEPSTYVHVNDHGNVTIFVEGEVVHSEV